MNAHLSHDCCSLEEANLSIKIQLMIEKMLEFSCVDYSSAEHEQELLDKICTLFGGTLHHAGGGIWLGIVDCGRYYITFTDEYLSLNLKPQWSYALPPDCLDQILTGDEEPETLAIFDFVDGGWRGADSAALIFGSVLTLTKKGSDYFTPAEWIVGLHGCGLLTLEGLEYGEPEDMKKNGKPLLTKTQSRWMRSKFIECGRLLGSYEAFDNMAYKLVCEIEGATK